MLGVLQFKKSVFSGVLDDGSKDVFLGGSRLQKFLETVEETTASIPAAAESDPPPGRDSKKRARPTTEEQEPETQTPARPDPWAGLLQAGLNLLEQFAAASGSNARSEQAASAAFPVVRRRQDR